MYCANAARIGIPSPNKTRSEVVDMVLQFYPTHGAQYLADKLDMTKSSILNLSGRLGITLEKNVYYDLVHGAAQKHMKTKNPMFRDEVRMKVKKHRDSNPEAWQNVQRKLFEGHSRIRKDKPTKLEEKLYQILKDLDINFEPQAIIKDKFIVDARIGNLIIQADGEYWHGHPRFEPLTDRQKAQCKRDAAQDKYLTTCGYTVVRIWERDLTRHVVINALTKHGLIFL